MATISIPTNYEENVRRSSKNLSKTVRYTTMFGLNIPNYFKEVKPDDYLKVRGGTLLMSEPLIAPLMGNFKLREIAFYEPFSNLYGWYDNNTKLTTEELLSKHHHRFQIPNLANSDTLDFYAPQLEYTVPHETVDASIIPGIPRGGILDYIGVPPGFVATNEEENITIPVDRILAYIDVIRSYLRNTQEESIPYLVQPMELNPTEPRLTTQTVTIKLLDSLFKELRYQDDGVLFSDTATFPIGSGLAWFNNYLKQCLRGTNSGIFLAMFEPDYYNNFLNNKIGAVKSVVTVTNNTFNIHELYYKNKLQKIIDRYDISGGIIKDWSKTLWGKRIKRSVDIPDIIAANTRVISARDITITANNYQENPENTTYAGEMTGQINAADQGIKYNYGFDMEGIVLHVSSIIPMVDYTQGFSPALKSFDFASDYKPQLAQLGFQNVPRYIYSALPGTTSQGEITVPESAEESPLPDLDESVAKQIAWLEMMTDTNENHGQLSNFGNKEFWTFKRKFTPYYDIAPTKENSVLLKDSGEFRVTRYINPAEWNYIFQNQTLTDHNLIIQHAYNIKAVRPIGKRFMPDFE